MNTNNYFLVKENIINLYISARADNLYLEQFDVSIIQVSDP